jgi:hypothetical protein
MHVPLMKKSHNDIFCRKNEKLKAKKDRHLGKIIDLERSNKAA